jgi:hypothetical protein
MLPAPMIPDLHVSLLRVVGLDFFTRYEGVGWA